MRFIIAIGAGLLTQWISLSYLDGTQADGHIAFMLGFLTILILGKEDAK